MLAPRQLLYRTPATPRYSKYSSISLLVRPPHPQVEEERREGGRLLKQGLLQVLLYANSLYIVEELRSIVGQILEII